MIKDDQEREDLLEYAKSLARETRSTTATTGKSRAGAEGVTKENTDSKREAQLKKETQPTKKETQLAEKETQLAEKETQPTQPNKGKQQKNESQAQQKKPLKQSKLNFFKKK